MQLEIITKNDLLQLKKEIVDEVKKIVTGGEQINKKWIKTKEVCKLLNCSPGTVQNLRINGSIEYTKIGGSLYYSMESILKIMEENKRNALES
jgi:excisionase family DNA binding protein